MNIKKILSALLVMSIILLCFISCQSSNQESQTTEKTEKIITSKELTTDNFQSYFSVKIYITNYHEAEQANGYYDCSCYLNVEIEKKGDVEITEEIPIELNIFKHTTLSNWSVEGEDSRTFASFDEDGYSGYSTLKIFVPKSGYFYETFKCECFCFGSKANDLPKVKLGFVNPKYLAPMTLS